ncbi:MAG TPA: GNAT family N-acetyltransferase [Naasia sp.]|jgi:GNAT superfamily N-acetyltransferase
MSAAGFIVRRTVEEDWREVRELRLEMLADTPVAYLETYEQAQDHPEKHWRTRARDGSAAPDRITVVAILDDGDWVGSMTGITYEGVADSFLVAVYVAEDYRGSAAGVTDALLAEIDAWARARGDGLRLEVNETNLRARAAYTKRGFTETGSTRPYPLDPSLREIEMRKPLR